MPLQSHTPEDQALFNAIESNDIDRIKEAITGDADITAGGNFAMSYTIEYNREDIAKILLENRFNILKNSNPILTLLTCLVANNKEFLDKMSNELLDPKIIALGFYECTPKSASSYLNTQVLKSLKENTELETLKKAKEEMLEKIRSSKTARPRYQLTVEKINEAIKSIQKELILKKIEERGQSLNI